MIIVRCPAAGENEVAFDWRKMHRLKFYYCNNFHIELLTYILEQTENNNDVNYLELGGVYVVLRIRLLAGMSMIVCLWARTCIYTHESSLLL
jgi:hypothetical protein